MTGRRRGQAAMRGSGAQCLNPVGGVNHHHHGGFRGPPMWVPNPMPPSAVPEADRPHRGGRDGRPPAYAALNLRRRAVPTVLHEIRNAVVAWAHRCALERDLVDDLELAVNEAVSNAVEHAYPPGERGDVVCELARVDGEAVAVRVRDYGRWRPQAADSGYRGRGLVIIRALGREVTFACNGGTEVRFRIGGR